MVNDWLQLFYLKAGPELHETIIVAIASIITLDYEADDRALLNQLITQYGFVQKMFKDVTSLSLDHSVSPPTFKSETTLLPHETVCNTDFLMNLIDFVRIAINQFFTDNESEVVVNQIYSITGLVTALFHMLKPPETEYYTYNLECLTMALDIFWAIMPNHNFVTDLNIMESLIVRTEEELQLLLKQQKYYHCIDNQWKLVDYSEQLEILQALLKLLDTPFERMISSRVQMAPTVARKIIDSNVLHLLVKGLKAGLFSESQLLHPLLLLSDVAKELPSQVEQLVDQGIIEAFLEQLTVPLIKQLPNFYLIIYFVNMVCVNKKGAELEKKYNILEKLFSLLNDEEFAGNYRCLEASNDFGKEVGELIRTIEDYIDPIAEHTIKVLQKHIEFQDKFMQRMDKLVKEHELKEEGELVHVLEQEVEIIANSTQSIANFFSRVFVSDFKMRKKLNELGCFPLFFKILSSPLLTLLESNGSSLWAAQPLKRIATMISNSEMDVQDMIMDILKAQVKSMEDKVGKLTEPQDLGVILADDMCYYARYKGLYAVIEKYRSEAWEPIRLMGTLSYIEILVEFLRYHDHLKYEKKDLYELVDVLGDIYRLVIKQIVREDTYFILEDLKSISALEQKAQEAPDASKDTSEPQILATKQVMEEEKAEKKPTEVHEMKLRCVSALTSSMMANRFSYHITLRKFFRKALTNDYDTTTVEPANCFASIILKTINSLVIYEDTDPNDEELLKAFINNNTIFVFMSELFMNSSHRNTRNHPEIFFTVHSSNGWHKLLSALRFLIRFFEKKHARFTVTSQPLAFIEILLKNAFGISLQRFGELTSTSLFVPVNSQLHCTINGKLEKSLTTRQESIYGVTKALFDQFIEIFKEANKIFEVLYSHQLRIATRKALKSPTRLDEFDDPNALPGQIQNFIPILFECFKRVIMQQVNSDLGWVLTCD